MLCVQSVFAEVKFACPNTASALAPFVFEAALVNFNIRLYELSTTYKFPNPSTATLVGLPILLCVKAAVPEEKSVCPNTASALAPLAFDAAFVNINTRLLP